ncbi:spore germination protein [Lederbergia citrea]|uniref:Spore germination protein n=1 Tax=Lederbergia citrea TaxID=2833581 RepID=A0A942USU9_9BACI|nr:spore germination protein [Lederbergia citrea]MBS4176458.1 spore germination protein [Lederbergia citrea]MBS4203019.1 spore germination protein [Lederbergia citrea]MBS4222309.1 spore germination protein [Lederbergia citrea]
MMKNKDLSIEKRIDKDLDNLENFFKKRVGLGTSFDIGQRKLVILKKRVDIYYVNGLTDSIYIIQIIKELVNLNNNEKPTKKIYELIENRLVHESVEKVNTLDEMVDQVLSGLIAVVIEGEETALIIDVRSYPGRQPEEPDTEKVVRGSRDGYVENIVVNTALTRRRIRDERLRFEIIKVGERSKADVAIGYIDGIANPDLIETIKKELKAIDIDGITMADKTIEEFVMKQGYNPYPLVRYTERADVGSIHLLEGHVLIFIDTSPSVIITPTTFFHHVQHAEEYRQSPAVGTFVRWTRFLGIWASIFLLPLWFLFVLEPSMLPEKLAFIGPNKESEIPLIIQLLSADLGVEFLRIAAIHTPTPLSTAMGLIAAVLIGQIAVDVGLFNSEVILYISLAAIGTFCTPSYELSVANKMVRMLLLILVAIFKAPGLIIGTTLYILFLAWLRPLNAPYLWPVLPFNPAAFVHILIRRTVPGAKLRPSIVHPRDRFRQPPK